MLICIDDVTKLRHSLIFQKKKKIKKGMSIWQNMWKNKINHQGRKRKSIFFENAYENLKCPAKVFKT